MQTTAVLPVEQQRRARLDSDGVLDLIGEPHLLDAVRSHRPEHRERLYPPLETLAMFVSQALSDDPSCQRVVNERIARALKCGTPVPSSSTAAYCRARQRLPLPLVREPCRAVARWTRQRMTDNGAAADRQTLLVDGTTVSMPDTPENHPASGGSAITGSSCPALPRSGRLSRR